MGGRAKRQRGKEVDIENKQRQGVKEVDVKNKPTG